MESGGWGVSKTVQNEMNNGQHVINNRQYGHYGMNYGYYPMYPTVNYVTNNFNYASK